MIIPKYWAKSAQSVTAPDGRKYALSRWQWSDISTQDAQHQATTRVAELARKVLASEPLNRYTYGDRPLREEISQAVTNHIGKEVAIVTRNIYGALIVNAESAMFVDIDFEDDQNSDIGSVLSNLFGREKINPEDEPLQHIQTWWEGHRDISLRVYRTFAGLRCLVTSHVFDPAQPDTTSILTELNSDPLYVRLCRVQECFRARLTPKPWRCNVIKPPSRYPWSDSASEMRYRQWEQRYEGVTAKYATCQLIKQFGSGECHPDVEPVLKLHDRLTQTESNLKLA